jgi:hypothetical protein
MEGEGSPSNHENWSASPEVAEAAVASSSVASSLESSKFSGLDWSASSRESGSTSSTSNSDESNDSVSRGYAEIMLSDTYAKTVPPMWRKAKLEKGAAWLLRRSLGKTWLE